MILLIDAGVRIRIRVEELLYKSARARVAHTLIDLGKQYGVTDAAGMTIPLRVNQRDLAALVGLTRETVNGVLQDLRQRGFVEFDRRSIRLKDVAALQAIR